MALLIFDLGTKPNKNLQLPHSMTLSRIFYSDNMVIYPAIDILQ